MGARVDGPPLDEGENYFRRDKCGGWFDARDLAWVEDHEGPLPHPRAMGRSNKISVENASMPPSAAPNQHQLSAQASVG
jgi:hypothetical protein